MLKIKFSEFYKIYLILGLIVLFAIGLSVYKSPLIQKRDIPHTLILQVPFSPQAPTDNWNRNEDCEETSIMMANTFLTGNKGNVVPVNAAQEAINNLKKWEQANLGYNIDTGADATTRMAEGAFGLKVKQILNFTENDLKRELLDNHPILLPINAKFLGTQQYVNGGPTYHMIVLRGFKGSTFVVNDPGTNNGNGNEYSFDVLKKAASDWNHVSKLMDPNRKIALVLSR
jgi:hypothetical protein